MWMLNWILHIAYLVDRVRNELVCPSRPDDQRSLLQSERNVSSSLKSSGSFRVFRTYFRNE